ncbi:Gtr1/RagA G protein conserved region-domain-containing protein [Gorgonomyces haynaldii]|nr:Gtr1/RagA G protein conserved region-domain-containing protein [Gorgonomyces haynaldii]
MGKSGSGKTSMRSIIFANYIARDTRRLGATIDVEHNHVRFLGNLVLNLWDCGGQEAFMENYISSQKDQIFRNVEVLIYVFDVESREMEKDLEYYSTILQSLNQLSPEARVFCLIHKMDLVHVEHRERLFQERSMELERRSQPMPITCFKTSIWDETLYLAWSSIVYSLIPNVQQLEELLNRFCTISDADEVVLFEKTTFLVISHASVKPFPDTHRFEKVSNIIKQFKLSCSRQQAQLSLMQIQKNGFSYLLSPLTNNTVILIVISDPSLLPVVAKRNIAEAKEIFAQLAY